MRGEEEIHDVIYHDRPQEAGPVRTQSGSGVIYVSFGLQREDHSTTTRIARNSAGSLILEVRFLPRGGAGQSSSSGKII